MHGPARALARLVRAVSRRLGRSGGTTAPGRMLLALSPRALGRMGAELDEGSVLISATNGKTTTAAMVAATLERAGRPVVHNRAGSNMAWGVATALLDAGRSPHQIGLFEVDEAWLPQVARELSPRLTARTSRASARAGPCIRWRAARRPAGSAARRSPSRGWRRSGPRRHR